MKNRAELKRLTLQIERDVLVRANLTVLLASADAVIVGRRRSLRSVKARIRRGSTNPPGRTR